MTSNGLATRIREARDVAGWRQEDLASKTGLSLGTIRNYEGGRTTPTLFGIRRIADALGVDLLWLLDGEVTEEVA